MQRNASTPTPNADALLPLKKHEHVLNRVLTPLRTALFAAEKLELQQTWAIRSALEALKAEHKELVDMDMDRTKKAVKRSVKKRRDESEYAGDLFDL